MQIAILLHDLQLHLIIINTYMGTILKLYIELIKDVHLNREEKFRPPDDHAHKLHA